MPLTRDERNSQIATLHEEGLTQTEVGELFNLSQRQIRRILKTLEPDIMSEINVSQILKERRCLLDGAGRWRRRFLASRKFSRWSWSMWTGGRVPRVSGAWFLRLRDLLVGRRRLEAFKHLGRKKIPAIVIDLEDIWKGEIEENVKRLDFTPSEHVAVDLYLSPKIKAKAKKRQEATQLAGKGIQKKDLNGAGKFPEPLGETRDIVAGYLGISGRTLDKEKKIVKASEEDPEKWGAGAAGARVGVCCVFGVSRRCGGGVFACFLVWGGSVISDLLISTTLRCVRI